MPGSPSAQKRNRIQFTYHRWTVPKAILATLVLLVLFWGMYVLAISHQP